MFAYPLKKTPLALTGLLIYLVLLVPGLAIASGPPGLSSSALEELAEAGVNQYLGAFDPERSEAVGDGWVKHAFDTAEGEGPICITGTEYSMFTREGTTKNKLLIMLQGGGACWQGLNACNLFAENQAPPFPGNGIWDFNRKDNPFRDHSVVYLPYCDGSVFGGDNTVLDPQFPGGVRHHRGLRNLSAGMDVAKAHFPTANKITVAGSSAGGVGAAAFAPFLVRFLYGNKVQRLSVFNDAGPIAVNLDALDAVAARANDWQFAKFYPASCSTCSASGDQTAIVMWRLDNDSRIREAFYETDADETNIGFASANFPGFFNPLPPILPFPDGLSQEQYRELVLSAHDQLFNAHPERYKRFIVSGDSSHTALQSDLFYTQDADGVLLNEWTDDFINKRPFWVDIVEDLVLLPAN